MMTTFKPQITQIKPIALLMLTPIIAVAAALAVLMMFPLAVIADGRLNDFFRPEYEYPDSCNSLNTEITEGTEI